MHGFGIRLSQIGARQIDGHHELKFQPATQIVQEGVVSLEAMAIQGQLPGQGPENAFTLGARRGHRLSCSRGLTLAGMSRDLGGAPPM